MPRTNRAALDGGIYLAMNEESSHDSATSDGAALPLVSVVIPHYNSLATLKNCVSLLDRQTFCRDRFEIIVADNNSSCGMDAVRGAAPAAKVIRANEQGAGPARNAGVAASKGSILAFIDSDCLPNFDWIEKGVAAIQAYDFIGGHVIVTSEDPLRPNPIEAFEMVFAFDCERYINRVGFTVTANMVVWRKVFDAVGPFRNGVAEDMVLSSTRPNLPAWLCRGLDRRTSRTANVVRPYGAMEADDVGRIFALSGTSFFHSEVVAPRISSAFVCPTTRLLYLSVVPIG